MSDNEKKISDLCVACGMCCDGTLFERGFIRHEDDKKIAESLGLPTLQYKDQLYFQMPCARFKNCCTAYNEPRPKVCSDYVCPPLKRFNRVEQSFGETEEQVLALVRQRNKLLELATQFPDLANLNFKELKNILEDYAEDEEKVSQYRMLFLFFFIFRDSLTKYFMPAKEDMLRVK